MGGGRGPYLNQEQFKGQSKKLGKKPHHSSPWCVEGVLLTHRMPEPSNTHGVGVEAVVEKGSLCQQIPH